MFGVLVAGRLVQTEFQKVDETHAVFNLEDADNINHIVVLMTGQQALPSNDFGGAVYLSLSQANGSAPSWHYLGFISNQKPSAIFKIGGLKSQINSAVGSNPFCSSLYVSHMVQIGISVEPISHIVGLTAPEGTKASEVATFTEFAKKMIENFMNYASSFALKQGEMQANPTESYVPASVIQQWVQTFERRFEANPYFWKS